MTANVPAAMDPGGDAVHVTVYDRMAPSEPGGDSRRLPGAGAGNGGT
ncbi:MAG TPA: hypothetical protein VF320_06800 [Acidimicrobiales bacterium]